MKSLISLLILVLFAGLVSAVDSGLEAGCDLEFGTDLEPTGSASIAVWNGASYVTTATPQWRCRPTDTDCAAVEQDTTNSIYQITNNGSIKGCLFAQTDAAAPVGMAFKCGKTNVAGSATSVTDSYTELDQDIAVAGTTNLWCWFDYTNPDTGWIFDLQSYYVS